MYISKQINTYMYLSLSLSLSLSLYIYTYTERERERERERELSAVRSGGGRNNQDQALSGDPHLRNVRIAAACNRLDRTVICIPIPLPPKQTSTSIILHCTYFFLEHVLPSAPSGTALATRTNILVKS